MKKTPVILTAILFCVAGFAVFLLNPTRSVNLWLGLALQALPAIALFLLCAPDQATASYLKYEQQSKKEQREEILPFAIGAVIWSALLLGGFKSGFVRFILLVFLWICLVITAEYVCFLVFKRFNQDWLDAEIGKIHAAKEAEEAEKAERLQAAAQEKAAKEAEEKAARNAKEEAHRQETKRIAAKTPASQTSSRDATSSQNGAGKDYPSRPRIKAEMDRDIVLALFAGGAQGSGLQAAIAKRTPEALAAVEGMIVHFSKNENPSFYRLGGTRTYTAESIQQAKKALLELAYAGKLLKDPGYSQSLIAGLGVSGGESLNIMNELATRNDNALFHYQLLGVQLQLATLLERQA